MFFCYARSINFASNNTSYFTLTNCVISVPTSSILPWDCGVPLTIFYININVTHIKNFTANTFSK
uniref:Uncharacterized protein n=1 Tax=Solanum tuberosum TaxID=4113 RepID=M0ZJD7_SOLTU